MMNLLNLSYLDLCDWVGTLGHKPFRAKQLWQWMHQRGVGDFAAMTNLSADFRADLQKNATITPPAIKEQHLARDGCVKFLLDVGVDNAVEAVLIPEDDRLTLCISTQVGCAMACSFCATGYQGFNRQLTLAEVVGQLWQANQYLQSEQAGALKGRRVSNVVFMGMGEPLANYKVTVAALKVLLDDLAYGLSRRRVTVSTSGLADAIVDLARDCPVSLALSLHAPNDILREQIMPVNKRYPLAKLLSACHHYLKDAPRAKIMVEYILLDGVNNTETCLQELATLCKNLPCKINLIPFNPFAAAPFRAPSAEAVETFARRLQSLSGRVVIVRRQRGDDVAGACGQLAGEVLDRRRRNPHASRAITNPALALSRTAAPLTSLPTPLAHKRVHPIVSVLTP